jgi:hypothetical protein
MLEPVITSPEESHNEEGDDQNQKPKKLTLE